MTVGAGEDGRLAVRRGDVVRAFAINFSGPQMDPVATGYHHGAALLAFHHDRCDDHVGTIEILVLNVVLGRVVIMQEHGPLQRQASCHRRIAKCTNIWRKLRMHLAHLCKMAEDFGAAVEL